MPERRGKEVMDNGLMMWEVGYTIAQPQISLIKTLSVMTTASKDVCMLSVRFLTVEKLA